MVNTKHAGSMICKCPACMAQYFLGYPGLVSGDDSLSISIHKELETSPTMPFYANVSRARPGPRARASPPVLRAIRAPLGQDCRLEGCAGATRNRRRGGCGRWDGSSGGDGWFMSV